VEVFDDFDVFHGDESAALSGLEELIENREKPVDFLFAVRDFHNNGKISGQIENSAGPYSAGGAEAHDSPPDRGSGKAHFSGFVDDDLVHGSVFQFIGFPEEDPQEFGIGVQLNNPPPSLTRMRIAIRPRANPHSERKNVPTAYMAACRYSLVRSISVVS